MNENSIIDKELEDDIFNLTVKENLFNQIEKEIEYRVYAAAIITEIMMKIIINDNLMIFFLFIFSCLYLYVLILYFGTKIIHFF